MNNEETNETNNKGTETDSNSKDNSEDTGKHFVSSPVIEAAKRENDRKADLLDRDEKLQTRKEKHDAEMMVGGQTTAGQETTEPAEESDGDYAKRISSGELKEGEGVPFEE